MSVYPEWQTDLVEDYQDVSIFQARTNTEGADIGGTSSYDLGGILYFPQNTVNFSGVGDNTITPGDQLICSTAVFGGTSTYKIQYNGKEAIMGFMSVLVHVVEP